MSQTVEGTIRRVFDPDAGTNKPWNVYLEDDDRRFATFKKEIVETIKPGVRGTLKFTESQRGQYTNYLIEGFEPMKTLDRELTDRGPNGAAPNYRQPTHPDERRSIHQSVALQRAAEHLQWLPEDERTMSSVRALYKEYLEILEGE